MRSNRSLNQFKSTVILASEAAEFQRVLFDEHRLFKAELDLAQRMILGPVAEFSYASGKFALAPNQIILTQSDEDILPIDLIEAVGVIASDLQTHHRPQHPVTAIGFNVEKQFAQQERSRSGADFCRSLVNDAALHELAQNDVDYACPRLLANWNDLRYDIRIEPYFQSNGVDLHLSASVQQEISPGDSLMSKIAAAEKARGCLTEFCRRLSDQIRKARS